MRKTPELFFYNMLSYTIAKNKIPLSWSFPSQDHIVILLSTEALEIVKVRIIDGLPPKSLLKALVSYHVIGLKHSPEAWTYPGLSRTDGEKWGKRCSGFPDAEMRDLIYPCHGLPHFQGMACIILRVTEEGIWSILCWRLCRLCRYSSSVKLFVRMKSLILINTPAAGSEYFHPNEMKWLKPRIRTKPGREKEGKKKKNVLKGAEKLAFGWGSSKEKGIVLFWSQQFWLYVAIKFTLIHWETKGTSWREAIFIPSLPSCFL